MRDIPKEFDGIGEVKGKHFSGIISNDNAYLYECTGENFNPHYEVFRARKNNRFGVISYPTSKSFGKWAWTFNSLEQAMEKFNEISEDNNDKM